MNLGTTNSAYEIQWALKNLMRFQGGVLRCRGNGAVVKYTMSIPKVESTSGRFEIFTIVVNNFIIIYSLML